MNTKELALTISEMFQKDYTKRPISMTEQEAFNDPEMKTILLLSGYVRELGEGKDYETTTYKLAETLVKVFSIHHVSQHREQLIGLLTKLENGGGSAFIDKEQIVDDYLKAI